MSIEKLIKDLTESIKDLTAAIREGDEKCFGKPDIPPVEQETPAPTERTEPEPSKEDAEESTNSTTDKVATVEDVRAIATALVKAGGKDQLAKVLKDHKAAKLSDVKEADLSSVFASLTTELSALS